MRHIDCSVFKSAVNLKLEIDRQMSAYEMQSILFCESPESRVKSPQKLGFWFNRLLMLLTTKRDNDMNVRN